MAKKYNCPNCNTVFASSQSLWNHKQRCGKHSYIVERDSEKNLPTGGAFPLLDDLPKRNFAESLFLGEEKKSLSSSVDKVIERLNCEKEEEDDLGPLFNKLMEDKVTNIAELSMIINIWLYQGIITMKRHQELNKLILSAQECKEDNESLIKATIGHFTKDYKVKLLKMIKSSKRHKMLMNWKMQ